MRRETSYPVDREDQAEQDRERRDTHCQGENVHDDDDATAGVKGAYRIRRPA
jgi:hypothetical protein